MRITTTNPTPVRRQAPALPKASLAQPVAAPAAPVVARAKAAAPAPATRGIEVDVTGQVDATGGMAATGTVKLDRAFVERLLRHVTRKPHAFGDRDLKFNAATNTYGGTLQLKLKGVPLNLAATATPVVDGNLPGFKFETLSLKLGGMTIPVPFLKGLAAKLIAKEITNSGIASTPGERGVVRLDPTSLLHEEAIIPTTVRINHAQTQFSVKTAANGDIELGLNSATPAVATADTAKSDLAVELDEKALARILKPVLGNDFQLSSVAIRQGTITLDGMVEAKPLSDVVNLGKTLLAIIAVANGNRNVNASPEKAMIGLKLDLKLEGTRALLTPDLGLALGELEKTLAKAGLNPVREGKGLRFDFSKLVAPYGVEGLEAADGKLKGRAKLDINQLIKAPILRGEKW
ncbi:MAG: hypothetical protein ACK46X_01680 [Candidatus Sericytochromatia bacterium]